MRLTARLALTAWLCAAAALAGAAAPERTAWANDLSPIAAADWDARRAAHLLERAGFGGTLEEVEKLARMTPTQAVERICKDVREKGVAAVTYFTEQFDKIKMKDWKPALMKAMDLDRAELAAIVDSKDPPTFDNTLGALEDAGRPFNRATTLMGVYTSTMSGKEMQELEKEMAPVLSAFSDEVIQNEKLFAKIKAVYDGRKTAKLEPDQLRLLETVYRNFARRGAALGAADKAKMKDLNGKLATAYTTFGQNQLADEESQTVVLDKEEELAGLPEELKASAKNAAEAKGQKGKWLITNTRSSAEPFLTYATRRDLREKVWKMWISRGDTAGAHDNKPVIVEILQLRAERAKLLGFPSHAHWIIDDNMAKTPDAAMGATRQVGKAAGPGELEDCGDDDLPGVLPEQLLEFRFK